MPKYIEVDKLAEHKFPNITFDRYVSDGRPKSEKEIYAYKVGYNDAIDRIIQFAPTADVVEIVRCKDCKHHTEEDLGMVYCPHIVGGWESMFHFCSHGERRDDE